jgi:hypothetical protein
MSLSENGIPADARLWFSANAQFRNRLLALACNFGFVLHEMIVETPLDFLAELISSKCIGSFILKAFGCATLKFAEHRLNSPSSGCCRPVPSSRDAACGV